MTKAKKMLTFFLNRKKTCHRGMFHIKKNSLTALESIRLVVSPLHSALRQPNGPLLWGLALIDLPLLVILLLHADNYILDVQISVG